MVSPVKSRLQNLERKQCEVNESLVSSKESYNLEKFCSPFIVFSVNLAFVSAALQHFATELMTVWWFLHLVQVYCNVTGIAAKLIFSTAKFGS